jgi:hypothetical protein
LEQLEREFNQLFREMQLHVRTSPELAVPGHSPKDGDTLLSL